MSNTLKNIINLLNESELLAFLSNIDYLFKSLVIPAFIIIIILINTIIFRRKINTNTEKQLLDFRNNGKYIDGLFVEIDNKKEQLRCYLFSKLFKKKTIIEHNKLVSSKVFKDISKIGKVRLKINRLSSTKQIIRKVKDNYMLIHGISDLNENSNTNLAFYCESAEYSYKNLKKDIDERLNLMSKKSVILVGGAGNGKTTLLCNIADMLISKKYPCLFINSRDVHGDILRHIGNQMFKYSFLKKHSDLFMLILNISLFLTRRYFIIILDALNENDDDSFINSIEQFQNQIDKYRRIKTIYSCRSEYYDIRSSKYFTKQEPYKISIDDRFVDDRAKEMLMQIYRCYYNYTGHISEDVKNKMVKNLLLMRMFFEVNRGKTNDTVKLYNHSIFKEYIEGIDSKSSDKKLLDILDTISDYMITNNSFEQVPVSKINFSKKTIESIIDNNIILSKKLINNKGEIHETEQEMLYFTFDEIRDYCLSRRVIYKCEQDQAYDFLFKMCDLLFKKKSSVLEGILKFSYFHLILNNKLRIACDLLFKYYNYTSNKSFPNKNSKTYATLGLEIIMDCDREFFYDFEKNYIFQCMDKINHEFIKLLLTLTYNEFHNYTPNLDIIIEGFLSPIVSINNLKDYIQSSFFETYYPHRERDCYKEFKNLFANNPEFWTKNENCLKLITVLSIITEDDDFFINIVHSSSIFKQIVDKLISECNNPELENELVRIKYIVERSGNPFLSIINTLKENLNIESE